MTINIRKVPDEAFVLAGLRLPLVLLVLGAVVMAVA